MSSYPEGREYQARKQNMQEARCTKKKIECTLAFFHLSLDLAYIFCYDVASSFEKLAYIRSEPY